jgi:hypothetical protein
MHQLSRLNQQDGAGTDPTVGSRISVPRAEHQRVMTTEKSASAFMAMALVNSRIEGR